MKTSTVIVHSADLSYQDLSGIDEGRAVYAGVLGSNSPAKIQGSFVEMEEVVIPRQARVEELLYIISGSIRVEENGTSTTILPGDTIYLTADSAPTYHVTEKTLIFAAYLA